MSFIYKTASREKNAPKQSPETQSKSKSQHTFMYNVPDLSNETLLAVDARIAGHSPRPNTFGRTRPAKKNSSLSLDENEDEN